MRALLLFMLCLTTPLQGIAIAPMDKPPCPMSEAAMAMEHAPSNDARVDEPSDFECCNDEATFALTGERCKSGQSCASGVGVSMLSKFDLSPLTVKAQDDFIFPLPLTYRFNLASIWRPPNTSTP